MKRNYQYTINRAKYAGGGNGMGETIALLVGSAVAVMTFMNYLVSTIHF